MDLRSCRAALGCCPAGRLGLGGGSAWFFGLFLGLEERRSLMSSLEPLWPRSAFLGLGERLAAPSPAFMGLAGLESPLLGFLLGLPVCRWFCCPLGRLACLLVGSFPAPGEPWRSSETVVSGEDGDCSEAERDTEDGDNWPSDAESLGKLEVGMFTLSFKPGKQQNGKKIIQRRDCEDWNCSTLPVKSFFYVTDSD